jgi:hypothetical protein
MNLSGVKSACQILFFQATYKNPVSQKEKWGFNFDEDRKEKIYLFVLKFPTIILLDEGSTPV